MYRYNAFSLNFSSEFELPECNAAEAPSDDFVIRNTQLPLPDLEPTNIFRRGIAAQTCVDTDGSLWLHWPNVATYRATSGSLLEVDVISKDPEIISLFTVSEALGLILFQRNKLLLHASAVKAGNEGWVFLGTPGAGKSTTCAAFVKAGCQLLSDDLTAITFDEQGNPLICPAYPQLKIWEGTVKGLGYNTGELRPVSEGVNKFSLTPRENFPVAAVPLQRIYFINHPGEILSNPIVPPSRFPSEVIKHFPMPNQFLDQSTLIRYFQQSLMCLNSASAYDISRPEDFEKLEAWVQDTLVEACRD